MPVTSRPTWAEIDLDAIRYNLAQLKDLPGFSRTASPEIMVVVKANAYGHGLAEVARTLEKIPVHYLGVATLDEAVTLREAGISLPILVLGAILPEEIELALQYEATLTLCDEYLAEILARRAKARHKRVNVHIKVDTGMGRIGMWHEQAEEFITALSRMENICMEGIYTHFAGTSRDAFTNYQLETFAGLLERLAVRGIHFRYRHAANSSALADLPKAHFNMVRPGIVVYGMYPQEELYSVLQLKPAFSLKTRVVYLKDVPSGRSISYGQTYVTKKGTRIATLPVGYADGYSRILSNRAFVLVKGQRAPVVGTITMDQTMVDVGHIEGVGIGEEVVLIGRQEQAEMRAEELARLSNTIPYEITCSITNRVPRVYKGQLTSAGSML